MNSDGRAGDVRFRTIPIPTPTEGSYKGGMVAQGVSKDCIFKTISDMYSNQVLRDEIGTAVRQIKSCADHAHDHDHACPGRGGEEKE